VPSAVTDASAILWRAPEKIALRDWVWGPGGQESAPKPPFQFISEDVKGANAMIEVRDSNGAHWTVKFEGEAHGDVFASRLLDALEYVAVPSYFVITGAHDLHRARPFVAKDRAFNSARFKLREHRKLRHVTDKTWPWNDNPFVGTGELNGLKILMILVSNWDAQDACDQEGSNTAVYSMSGSNQFYYAFEDWGFSMGKWGGFFERDRWDAEGYQAQTKDFAPGVRGSAIEWGYRGKHSGDITSSISAADIRWLLTHLSRITDDELRAGLQASGATDSEVDFYSRSIRSRIAQLEHLASADTGRISTAQRFSLPTGFFAKDVPEFQRVLLRPKVHQ
jgi:hypothetical protein